MPVLIDGNNLIFALPDSVGRSGLCDKLSTLLEKEPQICVVFDGPPPPGGLAGQIEATGIEVRYSAGRTADEVIMELISAHTAPRRLTVVSSDREIRKAARRRRCMVLTSPQFAKQLQEESPRPSPPFQEPKEKQRGLTEQQSSEWLKEFGLEEPD
jgi:hypothetical protein